MIVPGVAGDTSIFRLPKYINICPALNIAISYIRLQGALIYEGCMWTVNGKLNCICTITILMCGIDYTN